MDRSIKDQLAVVVADDGWAAAEAWLQREHPSAALADFRPRIEAEFANEARFSLISAIASLLGPIVVVACYQLLSQGVQPISGRMGMLLGVGLGGLVVLGIVGSWQAHIAAKRLS